MRDVDLKGCIGRTEAREDIAEAGPIRRLAALLDFFSRVVSRLMA